MDIPRDLEDPTTVGKKPKKQKPVRSYLIANIQRLMEERGTNAQEVSIAAGLSPSFVSEILRGKSRNPSLDSLEAIAAALGTDVSSLLEEEPSAQSGISGIRRPLPYKQVKIAVVGVAETAVYRLTSDAVRRLIEGPLHPDFPHAQPFAVEIRDVAMNAAKPIPLPLGFDAVYIDLRAENLVVESGYIYAIRRARDPRARRPRIDETIIRRAKVFADRVELTAETSFKGAGSFEKIIIPGKLTTNPEQATYAFGLVYAAVGFCYNI